MKESVEQFPINSVIGIGIGILIILASIGVTIIALYVYDTFFHKEEDE